MQAKEIKSHNDQVTCFLMSTVQAAAYTGMSKRFFELKRLTGDGPPFIRLSAKAVRYRKTDLDAWLEERLQQNTSGGPV
jgi:predicted DNA-binding transcriptional regulator AlpA